MSNREFLDVLVAAFEISLEDAKSNPVYHENKWASSEYVEGLNEGYVAGLNEAIRKLKSAGSLA